MKLILATSWPRFAALFGALFPIVPPLGIYVCNGITRLHITVFRNGILHLSRCFSKPTTSILE